MDLINNLQLLRMSRSTKVFVVLCIIVVGSINMLLFSAAFIDRLSLIGEIKDRSAWVSAGISLTAVLFPFFLIIVVLAGAESGERTLKRKVRELLTETIPASLQLLRDNLPITEPDEPEPAAGDSATTVTCRMRENDFYADYVIATHENMPSRRPLRILMRVEVNVCKININVLFEDTVLARMQALHQAPGQAPVLDGAVAAQLVRQAFPHTMGGATASVRATAEKAAPPPEDGSAHPLVGPAGGYIFNHDVLVKTINGRRYYVLVATRYFSNEFLWNAAEKLFFSQDLVLGLRSFLTENPEVFVVAPGA